MKIGNDSLFFAIQFFIDVDECTHNLHNCAPNMQCVNEYGSFLCKGLPYTLLNNIDVIVFVFGDVFIVFFSFNQIASCRVIVSYLMIHCPCTLTYQFSTKYGVVQPV